jgi:hypothetical protein
MDKLQEIWEAKKRADNLSEYITRDIDQSDDWLEFLLDTVESQQQTLEQAAKEMRSHVKRNDEHRAVNAVLRHQNTTMKEALEWIRSNFDSEKSGLSDSQYHKEMLIRVDSALSTMVLRGGSGEWQGKT